MKAFYFKHLLSFHNPSGTSRGILKQKESWFIVIVQGNKTGIGECSLIEGLSPDPVKSYEQILKTVCENISDGFENLSLKLNSFPSILFGLETAFRSFESHDPLLLFPSAFTKNKDSIAINGLIWMGEKNFMISQIKEKINAGFDCIKIKIGSLDFKTELDIIKNIRKEYSLKNLEIRVDANCAFTFSEALEKLKKLSDFSIHSIEQPIQTRQWENMAFLCEKSPLAIALDEELISLEEAEKEKMLQTVNPSYIILKPSLLGGLRKSNNWINIATKNNIKWWATSALESNIGLNAIAQWVYGKSANMKQGLGTGKLFSNNILSPYIIEKGHLKYFFDNNWGLSLFEKHKKIML